jgi:adenine C2-methylase RlmN of 23S rRNA A2503 and tRNA A37
MRYRAGRRSLCLSGSRNHAPANDDLDGGLAPRAAPVRRRGRRTDPLALSLHAPEDALRSELMPVNDCYPLGDVLAECRRHRAALARLLGPKDFKVNLIPYNPTGHFDGSPRTAMSAFRTTLVEHDVGPTGRGSTRASQHRHHGERVS